MGEAHSPDQSGMPDASSSERRESDLVVERVVQRFERAWRAGSSPNIDDYLSAKVDRARLLVELIHADLEFCLRAAKPIRVESYLARYAELGENRQAIIELIKTEVNIRRLLGEQLGAQEYQSRFPKLADSLSELFESPDRPAQVHFPVRLNCPHCHNPIQLVASEEQEVVCPSCGSSFQIDSGHMQTWSKDKLPKLGKFELLNRLGFGAFGTVYKAYDSELKRTVALKLPRSGTIVDNDDEDRFMREARSAAQLRHPGIIPIFEVGRSQHFLYLVSELVDGITLADALTARRLSFRESAQFMARVADALAYSHKQGVVHRDLKPSNIMLSPNGAPRIMDFGLAKRETGEITMTIEGQVLGTPAYMSPEQASGKAHEVDGRSDVYSMGVILYELLTGELPFRGNQRMLLHQVMHDEPRAPRSLNDRIPRDLETICLKAMSKEPDRRYGAAAEFAGDLNSYLDGKPIQARPVARTERAWRWCKRNPLVASLSLLTLLLASVLTVGSLLAAIHLATARQQMEERLADSLYQQARSIWSIGKPGWRSTALDAIKNAARISPTGPLRDLAIQTLIGRDVNEIAQAQFRSQIRKMVLRPDGRQAAAVVNESVLFWDIEADPQGLRLEKVGDRHDGVVSLEYSRNSSWLLVGTGHGECTVFDVRSGKKLSQFHVEGEPTCYAFGPSTDTLVAVSRDRIELWDWSTQRKESDYALNLASAQSSPTFAIPVGHNPLKVFTVLEAGAVWFQCEDAKATGPWGVAQGQNSLLAISPDRKYLVVGFNHPDVALPPVGGVQPPPPPTGDQPTPSLPDDGISNRTSTSEIGPPPPDAAPPHVQTAVPRPDQPPVPRPDQPLVPPPDQPTVPAPDQPTLDRPRFELDPSQLTNLLREATSLPSAPEQPTIEWPAERHLTQLQQQIQGQPFVLSGQATTFGAGFGRTDPVRLQIYDLIQHSIVAEQVIQAGDLAALVTYENDRFVVATRQGAVLTISFQGDRLILEERSVPAPRGMSGASASVDGRHFLTQEADNIARVWRREGFDTSRIHLCSTSFCNSISLAESDVARVLKTEWQNGSSKIQDYANGHFAALMYWFKTSAISPDGRFVAGVDPFGDLAVYELSSNTARETEPKRLALYDAPDKAVWALAAFSKDNKCLIAGGKGNPSAIFRQSETGYAFAQSVGHEGEVIEICIDANDEKFAVAYGDESLRLFNSSNGEQTAQALGLKDIARGISFSPDGYQLACGSSKRGGMTLRSAPTLQPIVTLDSDSLCWSTAFSHDGRRLAIGHGEGTVSIYDVATKRRVAHWQAHRTGIVKVRFVDDGQQLQTCDIAGGLISWNLAKLRDELTSIGLSEGELIAF